MAEFLVYGAFPVTGVLGEPLDLRFEQGHYGPYSERLEHVLSDLEGHYITGFGDRSRSVSAAEPIQVTEETRDEIERYATEHQLASRVDRVLGVVDGFNSAYGTELLATVLWAADNDESPQRSVDSLTAFIHDWNRRKARLFTAEHVNAAMSRLSDEELLSV